MNNKTGQRDEETTRHDQPRNFNLSGTLSDSLAKLRGVRQLGKDKLGLREAIAVAREQGEAYRRWCERRTLIGRVQVWVEGRLVITVSPQENSVNLKAFNFDVASPRNAVMQIVKADESEERVVLLNLPLSTFSPNSPPETTLLPNGQTITLKIAPQENGRFDVEIVFAAKEEASDRQKEHKPLLLEKGIGVGAKMASVSNWGFSPTLLNPPVIARNWTGHSALAFSMIVVMLFGAICGLMALDSGKSLSVAENPTQHSTTDDSSARRSFTVRPFTRHVTVLSKTSPSLDRGSVQAQMDRADASLVAGDPRESNGAGDKEERGLKSHSETVAADSRRADTESETPAVKNRQVVDRSENEGITASDEPNQNKTLGRSNYSAANGHCAYRCVGAGHCLAGSRAGQSRFRLVSGLSIQRRAIVPKP
ncbi:MAG: hypothetical protein WAQ99_12070 [Pyrinomonadaceae bacterium]